MTVVRWQPALGEPVEFRAGRAVPYRLLSLDGIGPVASAPIARRSPGQIGETAVDVLVPPRVVSAQLLVQAESREALWPLRAALARALVTEPAISDTYDVYSLGRLRVLERIGSPDLELKCIPRSVHLPAPAGGVGFVHSDVEFYAPMPWWESLYESQLWFGSGEAGLGWPVEWPVEFASNNVEQEATNEGDVRAPVTMRLHGEMTTARLTNVETGAALEVTGAIEADEYIEVSTAYGQQRVELVEADGTRTNVMDRLNLSIADFWQLLPGANTVRFEATVNTSGRALLLWRSRYSGI